MELPGRRGSSSQRPSEKEASMSSSAFQCADRLEWRAGVGCVHPASRPQRHRDAGGRGTGASGVVVVVPCAS